LYVFERRDSSALAPQDRAQNRETGEVFDIRRDIVLSK
jgi:hypothetical protein